MRRHDSLSFIASAAVAVAAIGLHPSRALGQNAPQLDEIITAASPTAGAGFGSSMAIGKIGNIADLGDDVVSCAILEDETSTSPPLIDLGAAYPFRGNNLQSHPFFRLLPTSSAPPQSGIHLGERGVEIGNVRGSGQSNFVFIGGIFRDHDFTECDPARSQSDVGSVEIYDLESSPAPIKLLLPPAEPDDCSPVGVRLFGHHIAIGDVNGNGIDDLIVGAPGSDEGIGRVYVFFGYGDFAINPHYRWVGLKPNGDDESVFNAFGIAVAADDLDGDGKAEVIIGRGEQRNGPGRVYIVSGDWVTETLTTSIMSTHELPLMTNPITDVQLLNNPLAENGDEFGFRVYAFGDVGSEASSNSTLDTLPDLLVHATLGDYRPGQTAEVNDAGALYAFFNNGALPGFVHAGPVDVADPVNGIYGPLQLTTPGPVDSPQMGARYGRSCARVRWMSGTLASYTLNDYLLVGEPDADISGQVNAGRIHMLALPVKPELLNLWPGSNADPFGPQKDGTYCSEILAGDYIANQTFWPGQQIVVSARGWNASPTILNAGRAYSFTPLTPP